MVPDFFYFKDMNKLA